MKRGLPNEYLDLLNRNNNKIFYWIRAHPAMSYEEIDLLEKQLENYQNCNFKLATSSPLYNILSKMDVHITQNSTVTKEAALLDIPSIVIHESGRDLFIDEINEGIVFFKKDPKKILKKIQEFSENTVISASGESDIDFSKTVLSILKENL
jgi:predicted glycosyltransferase